MLSYLLYTRQKILRRKKQTRTITLFVAENNPVNAEKKIRSQTLLEDI
jgi:hypothetical protein